MRAATLSRRLSDGAAAPAAAPAGYCKGDLPHSDWGSPPTQHRPCAKPAGQVGGSPVRGCRSAGRGAGWGKQRVWGCCPAPGTPLASLGAFPIFSLTKL